MSSNKQITPAFNFTRTLSHPVFGAKGIIEMLPTPWVSKLANPEVSIDSISERVDLKPASLETLWEDMKTNGMAMPFILSAGRWTQKCRLEHGSKRLLPFLTHKILYIPTIAIIADHHILYAGNGKHEFKTELLIPPQQDPTDFCKTPETGFFVDERTHARPSDVFAEIRTMKEAGKLPAPDAFT